MSSAAIAVAPSVCYTRMRDKSNERSEVGEKNVMKPKYDRSEWVCDGMSAECERDTRVDGENRYLGIRWTNRWRGGEADLCEKCVVAYALDPATALAEVESERKLVSARAHAPPSAELPALLSRQLRSSPCTLVRARAVLSLDKPARQARSTRPLDKPARPLACCR